jgi:hypothetical protein
MKKLTTTLLAIAAFCVPIVGHSQELAQQDAPMVIPLPHAQCISKEAYAVAMTQLKIKTDSHAYVFNGHVAHFLEDEDGNAAVIFMATMPVTKDNKTTLEPVFCMVGRFDIIPES